MCVCGSGCSQTWEVSVEVVDGVGHRVASICVMRCVGQLLCSWLSRMRDRIRFSFCFGVVFVTEVLCLVPLRVSTSFSRARMQRFRKCRM